MVSTPKPRTSRSPMSHCTVSWVGPGVWAPSARRLAKAEGSLSRFAQPVRNSSQAPAGMRPCRSSQALRKSTVSSQSSLPATSALASTTTAGPMKLRVSMVSTVLSGWSLPVIQWAGGAKCVPVWSPEEKLFQYQPGPASSECEMRSDLKAQTWPNCGGSCRAGKSLERVWVRSMTRRAPEAMSCANWASEVVMVCSPAEVVGRERARNSSRKLGAQARRSGSGGAQRLGQVQAGAAAQARAGGGGCANVPPVCQVCLVVARCAQGAPEEGLVQAAIAAVGVAADQVHVQARQAGRRQDGAGEQAALQIRHRAREALDDARGIGFAQRGRPARACGHRDEARRVANGFARAFGELYPQDVTALGRAARGQPRGVGTAHRTLAPP